jgi:predicted mannosyl-3-phosphoglycerate phosphatase (HAD superfamily)
MNSPIFISDKVLLTDSDETINSREGDFTHFLQAKELLADADITVGIVTSKAVQELAWYADQHPEVFSPDVLLFAESGGVFLRREAPAQVQSVVAGHYFDFPGFSIELLGSDISSDLDKLEAILLTGEAELEFFKDLSPDERAQRLAKPGFTVDHAERMEPRLTMLSGFAPDLDRLRTECEKALAKEGYKITIGSSAFHISKHDKSLPLEYLRKRGIQRFFAVGDGPGDVPMLAHPLVERAALVRNFGDKGSKAFLVAQRLVAGKMGSSLEIVEEGGSGFLEFVSGLTASRPSSGPSKASHPANRNFREDDEGR